ISIDHHSLACRPRPRPWKPLKLQGLKPGSASKDLKPLTPNKYIKLNVGGSLPTLCCVLSLAVEVPNDVIGWVLIDQGSHPLGTILSYLQGRAESLPESSRELRNLPGRPRRYLVLGL
ncbi:BACD1 protein, partial [Crocuta crocuta]